MQSTRFSRTDLLSATVVWLATIVIFGVGASGLGFYTDDAGFLSGLPAARLVDLWTYIRGYVPGRNLHVLWQYLIYKLVGKPVTHLTALHVFQSALHGLVAVGFFLLLRSLGLRRHVGVIAAGLLAVWPISGETHYWLAAAPQNLISTLFVLLFVMTTLALAAGSAPWWVRVLDAIAFSCALFTYDQVFFVLLLLVGVRLVRAFFRSDPHRWRFAAFHSPYLLAVGFYVWLKLNMQASAGPVLRAGSLQMLTWNVRHTVSNNLGAVWWVQVHPFYSQVTVSDWLLSLAVAVALTALALWLLRQESPVAERAESGLARLPVFLLASSFYIAAYLPIWLWYIAPRHHYLPSLGLFAGGAVCLAALLQWLNSRTAQGLVVLSLGAVIFFWAAASRGESHYWKDAFSSKQRLFIELKSVIAGKEVLALEDFPSYLGSAPWVSLLDATFAARLFYHDSPSLIPRKKGSIGAVPAPGGWFLYSNSVYDPDEFQYHAAQTAMVVRFTSWDNHRLKFQEVSNQLVPYEVHNVERSPEHGSFALHDASVRTERDGIRMSLAFSAGALQRVAAIVSFWRGNGFHRWGQVDREGRLNIVPVLLTNPSADHTSSRGYRWVQDLRITSFPGTDRIRLEFFEVGADSRPVRLGGVERAVTP